MHVVVLAAGKGTRLKHMTEHVPKPMVTLAGRPIIWHVLSPLLKLRCVRNITVVTGFRHTILEAYIHQSFSTYDKIHLVHHKAYDAGNLSTLLRVKAHVRTTFMITNADHIFHPQLLSTFTVNALVHNPEEVTIGCHRDRPLTPDDMKVQLDQGHMTDIGKGLSTFDAGYLGLTIVPEHRRQDYFDYADATVQKQGHDSVVEQVLLEAARGGMWPRTCDLTGLGWYEIDTPEDHAIAEQGVRDWKLPTTTSADPKTDTTAH